MHRILVIVYLPDVTPEDEPDSDHEDIELYGEWVEEAGSAEETVRHTVPTHTEVSEFKVTIEDIQAWQINKIFNNHKNRRDAQINRNNKIAIKS